MKSGMFLFVLLPIALAWDYKDGGAGWPGLCESGERQSPIDIDDDDTDHLDDRGMYVYYYGYTKTRDVVNDGKDIYIGGGNFGYIRVDDDDTDRDFYAEKVVFKMPSEHTFNGEHSEMEIQVYHNILDSDADPDFPRKAILSIMIRPGDKSYFVNSI